MQTQEVNIQPNMSIIMKTNAELLDEVMVVAYGTAKKSAFTGSATVVHSEEIGKIQSSNVANALEGKVAGVQLNNASGQPGATTPTIRIRGISSINAGNDPLIILDGSPYEGDLNNISTQDIESMTVLKDAASNALYGARGANGVIIITTKKGTSGKATVTVDAKWGSNSRSARDYNYVKSPAQYYEMYYGALKSYFMGQGQSEATAHVNANNSMTGSGDYGLGYNVYTVPEGQYLIGSNGKLNPNAVLGNVVSYNGQDYLVRSDNWLDEAYKTGLRQEYNVSISAGTDKSSFYASVSYLNNEGIVDKSDYERLTGRLKADYQVKDWLKVGANMSYTHFDTNSLDEDGSSNSSGNIFAYATQIAPIYPLYIRDGQGNIMRDSNDFTMYDFGNRDNAGLTRPFLSGANPYASNLLDTNNNEGNAMTATGFAEIRFLKDFKFTWTSGVAIDETRTNGYTNPYYGQYASSNGIANKYHTRQLSYNHQQILNWKRSFDRHNVDVMLGHESFRYKYYYLYASKSNSFDPNNIELAGAITNVNSSSYIDDYNTEGYFGRVQYDFNEKYFLSASYRRDASSRFSPDNRWGDFWAASAAWMITHEDFMKDVEWLDMLKLKASFGQQGNDDILFAGGQTVLWLGTQKNYYPWRDQFNMTGANGVFSDGTLLAKGNEDITWETSTSYNIGVEFAMFGNKLNGSLEYFGRRSSDMLYNKPVAGSVGYTSIPMNIGSMTNSGFEIDLSYNILSNKHVTWGVNLNATFVKNKINELHPDLGGKLIDGNYIYEEGESMYRMYLVDYAGVDPDTGEALYWMTNDKGERVTTNSYVTAQSYKVATDNFMPKVYGGLGTSVEAYGFDASVQLSYQLGGKIYDSGYARMMHSGNSNYAGQNWHKDIYKAWTPDNRNTDVPRLNAQDMYTNNSSTRWITNSNYLSINNITVGYTLPTEWVRKMTIEKLRVYFAADNVCVFSARKGLDPRQSYTTATTSLYTPIRTISGGISLTF